MADHPRPESPKHQANPQHPLSNENASRVPEPPQPPQCESRGLPLARHPLALGRLLRALRAAEKLEEAEQVFRKALGACYLDLLGKEYDYRMSNEAVDEDLRANEYLFTEDGERTHTL